MASGSLKATELVEAATCGELGKLRHLLQVYPSQVDIQRSGRTALQVAAHKGHVDVIKTLLRNNADLHFCDTDYSTPLHFAVMGDKPEAVKILLQNGAKLSEKDILGRTPPQIAFNEKYKECVKVFMAWDADVKFKPSIMKEPRIDIELPRKPEEECTEATIEPNKDAKKCTYCNDNVAAIKFEPCNCEISCFECSLSMAACECGAPIEKRSYHENHDLERLIREIKSLRRKNQQLIDTVTCHICKDKKIDCTLACGHIFCISCVRKLKDERTHFPDQLWKCPMKCKEPSRYIKIHADWNL